MSIIQWFSYLWTSLEDRLHLKNIQINLVFCSICTIFALCNRFTLGWWKGNRVKFPNSPAAVSRPSRRKHGVTEIIGKTFATWRQVRRPADEDNATHWSLGIDGEGDSDKGWNDLAHWLWLVCCVLSLQRKASWILYSMYGRLLLCRDLPCGRWCPVRNSTVRCLRN